MARTYNLTCEECKEPFAARNPRQRQCDPCWGKMMGAVRVEYRSDGDKSRRRTAIIVCRKCETEYSATRPAKHKYPGLCRPCSIAANNRETRNGTCEECKEPFAARGSNQRLCDDCWGEMMGAVRVEYRFDGGKGRRRAAVIVCHECETEYVTTNTKHKYPGLCKQCSTRTPETRAKMSETRRGKKASPEHRANIAAGRRGKKHASETCAKISLANHKRVRRGVAQGGKYGWIYVVSGPGQVKVGGSMNEKSLARRLVKHERNGLTEVHATWQVDPKHGSKIEAAAITATLAGWDQVGTIVRPDGGTETVWCDDPAAIVALVESVISQEQ